MVCPFLFADILALCRGEQCSPVRVLKSTKVMGSNGRPQVAPTNIVRMCLGFAQAVFNKVENFVLGYAQDG